jgi:hypothetical protein
MPAMTDPTSTCRPSSTGNERSEPKISLVQRSKFGG